MAPGQEVRRRAVVAGLALAACAAGVWAVRRALPASPARGGAPEEPAAGTRATPRAAEVVPVAPVPRGTTDSAPRERAMAVAPDPSAAPASETKQGDLSSLGQAADGRADLPGQAPIGGQVGTPAGTPLARVMVSAAPDRREPGLKKLWTRTDASGRYRFHVPERQDVTYRVQVAGSSEDWDLRRLIQSMKRAGGLRAEGVLPGSEHVDFEIPVPGRLNLLVVDAETGLAVDDVAVRWKHAGDDSLRPYSRGQQGLVPQQEGRLSLPFPTGPIELELSAVGYARHRGTYEVIPGRGSTPLVVELEPNPSLRVHLVVPPEATARDFNPDVGPFSRRNPDGSLFYPGNILLVTGDEWDRAKAEVVDNWTTFAAKNWTALDLGNRWLVRVSGNEFVARPEPGRYRLVAFPDLTQFDPEYVEVDESGGELMVHACPKPAAEPNGR